MMTTHSAFKSPSPNQQLITEVNPLRSPIGESQKVNNKETMLKEYIEKFVRGEISAEQLETIKKTLE